MAEVFAEDVAEGFVASEISSEDLSEDGDWVRKSEAAARLGVSERTIDYRLAQGRLQKRLRKDGAVEILVPKKAEDDRAEKALFLVERYHQSVAQQLVPLLEQNKQLIDKVASQAETIGMLRAENENLQKQLQKVAESVSASWWQFWKRS